MVYIFKKKKKKMTHMEKNDTSFQGVKYFFSGHKINKQAEMYK